MENSMPLLWEVTIEDPPTKYTIPYKRPKFDKDGKLISQQVYYLTSNLFFNNATSFHVISKIVLDTKLWLHQHMTDIPDIEKMKLHIVYRANKEIDLDNKAYWWRKLFMDILKTPTEKQLANAKIKKRVIVTVGKIKDDSTKYVSGYSEEFILGGHSITFQIFGREATPQKQLNLI